MLVHPTSEEKKPEHVEVSSGTSEEKKAEKKADPNK